MNEDEAREAAGQFKGAGEAPDSWLDAIKNKEETAFPSALFSSADATVAVHTATNTHTGTIRTRTAGDRLHIVVTNKSGDEVIVPYTAVEYFREVTNE